MPSILYFHIGVSHPTGPINFRFCDKYPVCIPPLPHALYIPRASQLLDLITLIIFSEELRTTVTEQST